MDYDHYDTISITNFQGLILESDYHESFELIQEGIG